MRNTRGQILSLVRQNDSDRNRHLSPIITRIQDNGPMLPEPKPARKKPKSLWTLVDRQERAKQAPAKPVQTKTRENPVEKKSPDPKPEPVQVIVREVELQRSKMPLSVLMIGTVLMACTVFYISTLNARIDGLQQEVSSLNGKVEILQEMQE